ncbi:MAG: molybdenum cofactor guanylyltransferase, partial [Actinomycetota bacterium]|nr:molybdenum cofactor guanylyltransferase [Actinomycetota bacterium]
MRVEGVAGIVLAGGRSSRMGVSKAGLEWHGSTLLYRAAALLTRAVAGPVVVVRAADQVLPPLPAGVAVAVDPVAGLGPMQGIAAGLGAVADRANLAFVCSTDLPFLHPAFVARVLCQLRDTDVDAVVPVAGGYRQPLAAGYRTRLVKLINALLAAGDLRPGMLLAHCAAAMPDDEALLADPELARLDPELSSVLNVNTPDDYAA